MQLKTFPENRRFTLAGLSLATLFALGACVPAPTDAEPGGSGGSGGTRASGGSGGGAASGGSGGGSASGGGSGQGGAGSGGSADSGGTGGTAGSSSGGGGGSATGGGGGSSNDASTSSGGAGGGSGGSGGGGSGGKPGDAGASDTGAGTVTFTQLYTEIFSTTCAGATCHNPGTSDGISFKDKATAFKSLVPKTTASILVGRLESTDISKRMPKNKPALSTELIQKVKDWIKAGAKND